MNQEQIIDNNRKVVEYYIEIDTLKDRIRYINNNFKKSIWRKRLVQALVLKRKKEMRIKFEMICEKFNVKFEKLNQIINGNYSLELKFDELSLNDED